MIKFDPSKEKTINFNIQVEGIDPALLEYNVRLSTGKIDYGFKGTNKNGTISFTIPALNEVANRDVINNLSMIRMEVNDKNNKYYLKPFEDAIKIQQTLKVEAHLSEEEDTTTDDLPQVNAELTVESEVDSNQLEEEDVIVEDEQENKDNEDTKFVEEKKTSKFSKFLEE